MSATQIDESRLSGTDRSAVRHTRSDARQTGSARMRAIHIVRSGSPQSAFEVRDVATPVAGADELLVRVRATGVNFADILARQGIYPEAPPRPCVVGYEVSGVVEAAGGPEGEAWIGKEVLALTDFGGYAEAVKVDRHYVWEKPSALSFDEAAAIPLNYVTAWGLLVAMGGLSRDETVLVHNAGGGVGLAALDIARHFGARVLGGASPRKHTFLKERGLDHAIDYTRADWPSEVLSLTDGKGVELAIDPIGGAHWKKTYGVLRSSGRMGMFGISSAAAGGGLKSKLGMLRLLFSSPIYHAGNLIPANRGVYGINIHSMYADWEKLDLWMRHILRGVEEGWVRPHVDAVFRFADVAAAHARIEARGNIGKVLLTP